MLHFSGEGHRSLLRPLPQWAWVCGRDSCFILLRYFSA